MTIERLKDLTDLETLLRRLHVEPVIDGNGFDMNRDYDYRAKTLHECGSACCIAGWIQLANKETRHIDDLEDVVLALAGGGDEDQARALCYPSEFRVINEGRNFYNASPLVAAHAVAIFRDTGKADWPEAERRAIAEEASLTSE